MKLRLVLATAVSLWAASAAASSQCVLPSGCAGGAWSNYYAAPIYPFYYGGLYGNAYAYGYGAGGQSAWAAPAGHHGHVARVLVTPLPARESAPEHEIVPQEIKF